MNTFRKGLDLLLGAICCLVLAIMVGILLAGGEPLHSGRSQHPYRRDAAISPGVGINAGHGFCRRSETAY